MKSRFNFWHVYITMAFYLFVVLFVSFALIHEIKFTQKTSTSGVAGYGILLIIIIPLLGAYSLQKKLNSLSISADNIVIRNLTSRIAIAKENILTIDLFARKNFGMSSVTSSNIGMKIITKENKKYFLADMYYSNSADLKNEIQKNFSFALIKTEYKKIFKNYANQSIEKFSGNFFLSLNNLTIVASAIACYFLVFKNESTLYISSFFIIMLIALYILYGHQSYHFLLSANELVVKNQIWFWIDNHYSLDDINDIVVERVFNKSNCLEINFKNFTSKNYIAGSLRDHTLKELIDRISSFGINAKSDILSSS